MQSISEVRRKIERNKAAEKRTRKRLEALRVEALDLEKQLRRAVLEAHVGEEVITRFRGASPNIDEIVGTLVAVRRTRCLVDYPGGEWTVPIENVLLYSEREQRGEYVTFGGRQ